MPGLVALIVLPCTVGLAVLLVGWSARHEVRSAVAGGPLAPDPGALAEVVAAGQLPTLAVPNGVA